MVRFVRYAILGVSLGSFLGSVAGTQGPLQDIFPRKQLKPIKKKSSIQPKKEVKEKVPPTQEVKSIPTTGAIATKVLPPLQAPLPCEKPYPPIPTPSKKKTLLIDARRLTDHKLTETIRYMKDHPNIRFKLQNMTIDATFAAPLLKTLKQANVLHQIKDMGFVMLNTAHGQTLNEKEFISEVLLPFLGYLEGLELSCLGVSDKVVQIIGQKIPELKSLSLFGSGITDAAIASLAKTLPRLTKLHLASTSITAKGLKEIMKKFSNLKGFGISGQSLKDNDFAILSENILNLQSFSAVGQVFKDMQTVKNLLRAMPCIQILDLAETNITDDVAQAIAETVTSLKNLDISDTKITKDGLKAIVGSLDLTTLKINGLRGIGTDELKLIADNQPGLRKFHFAGLDFNEASLINLILKAPKLVDVTFIPAAGSKWILSEGVAEALALKSDGSKLQYLHIQANRLPDVLRAKLEKEIPNLRIEYQA